MCWGCVQEAFEKEGAPWDWQGGAALPPVPLKYAQLCRTIRAFYQTRDGGVGGPLHVVLDDNNTDDQSIQWCLDHMDDLPPERYGAPSEQTKATCRAIAAALLDIKSDALRNLVIQTATSHRRVTPPRDMTKFTEAWTGVLTIEGLPTGDLRDG